MKIGTYISELLFDYEHVILPGFGEFSTRYLPARFIPEEKKILSPSKIVSFSQETIEGDTPLVAHIAFKEKLSVEQVQNKLTDFVNEIRNSLAGGQKVMLDQLGVFSRNADGQIIFEADTSINYLADAAGMGAVSEPPKAPVVEPVPPAPEPVSEVYHASETPITPVEPAEEPQKTWLHPELEPDPNVVTQEATGQDLPKAIKWLAWFIIPLLVIGIILAFNWSFIFGKRSIAPAERPQTELAAPAPQAEQPAETPAVASPETQTSAPAPSVAATPATQAQPEAGRRVYHIVVGAFQDQAHANRFVEELRAKGANQASIFMRTSTGMHRVSYGFYYDLGQAEAQLKQVQQQINPSAWILPRN